MGEQPYWRCFHCGMGFAYEERWEAEQHFGKTRHTLTRCLSADNDGVRDILEALYDRTMLPLSALEKLRTLAALRTPTVQPEPCADCERWQDALAKMIAEGDDEAALLRRAFGIEADGRSLKDQLLALAPTVQEGDRESYRRALRLICTAPCERRSDGLREPGCICSSCIAWAALHTDPPKKQRKADYNAGDTLLAQDDA